MRILVITLYSLLALALIGTVYVMVSEPSPSKSAAAAPKSEPAPVAANAEPFVPAGPPPDTILFDSEYGNVAYSHKLHYERVNGNCTTCHPAIFPQAREPLNYGKARHRVAEEYATSCATCHNVNGGAFAAERNCQKCHDMGPPQP
jgi:c(7)-type cytochrome triheme protein